MTNPALDPEALPSPAEAAPAQAAMTVRPILSHELVVGDYLGVIASMHQPAHFRRVEKLEYIDADLGRPHLTHDVFYLEAANMGPVIAWCHAVVQLLSPPRPDRHLAAAPNPGTTGLLATRLAAPCRSRLSG